MLLVTPLLHLTFPRIPAAVREGRTALTALQSTFGERFADAQLLVSELLTNAVLHGQGPEMELRVEQRGTRCLVEVVDGGNGFVPPRDPKPRGAGGRGLPLVNELADRWGAYEGGSTHVWFELS